MGVQDRNAHVWPGADGASNWPPPMSAPGYHNGALGLPVIAPYNSIGAAPDQQLGGADASFGHQSGPWGSSLSGMGVASVGQQPADPWPRSAPNRHTGPKQPKHRPSVPKHKQVHQNTEAGAVAKQSHGTLRGRSFDFPRKRFLEEQRQIDSERQLQYEQNDMDLEAMEDWDDASEFTQGDPCHTHSLGPLTQIIINVSRTYRILLC